MRPLLRLLVRLLVGLTWLYCSGIIILASLWLFGIQGIWWLDLANVFALWLCVPLLLLAPIAWFVPVRRLHGPTALAVIAFLGLFGPRFIPPSARPTGGSPLRLATFNLHYGLDKAQLADSIAAIRAQHADVVALQELSAPAADAIQRDLIGDYPYQALSPSESFTGMGVISRYALNLQQSPSQLAAQLALVRVGRMDVMLINASLTSPEIKRRRLPIVRWVKGLGGYHTSKRSRDIERLLRIIDQTRGPLIVAGDFNLSDREPEYSQFAARLHDAYRETSWGFGHTYPSSMGSAGIAIALPLIRIDYIWSAGGVDPAATWVACGAASDHCMVVADMQVGGAGAQGSAVQSR